MIHHSTNAPSHVRVRLLMSWIGKSFQFSHSGFPAVRAVLTDERHGNHSADARKGETGQSEADVHRPVSISQRECFGGHRDDHQLARRSRDIDTDRSAVHGQSRR